MEARIDCCAGPAVNLAVAGMAALVLLAVLPETRLTVRPLVDPKN